MRLVDRPQPMLAVVGVDLRLQVVTHRQQRAVAGREIGDDAGEPLVKGRLLDPRSGQSLVDQEVVQDPLDLQSEFVDRHGVLRAARRATRRLRKMALVRTGVNFFEKVFRCWL